MLSGHLGRISSAHTTVSIVAMRAEKAEKRLEIRTLTCYDTVKTAQDERFSLYKYLSFDLVSLAGFEPTTF